MPLTLGDKYHPGFRGYPPHMSKEDFTLWERFKLLHLKDVTALYFDVGLGGTDTVPQDANTKYAAGWLRVTQKRIDVLLEYPTKWVIVELRENAQSSAVGRLLMYKDMWNKEAPDSRPLELLLVTNYLDTDIDPVAKGLGIGYLIV